MKRLARCLRGAVAALAAALLSGCSVNTDFVYKPAPPPANGRSVPVKVAVLPFEDRTEDFTKRGSVFGDLQFNLAKGGFGGTISALPPAFWGKSFADDLAASGSFQSARFLYSPSDASRDEAYLIDGALKKVLFAGSWSSPNEILVSFKATRRSDGKVVCEKEAGRIWKLPKSLYDGCLAAGCVRENRRADFHRTIAALFAEARADLVATLASPDGGAGGSAGAKPAGASSEESAEQTIDRILKGKESGTGAR